MAIQAPLRDGVVLELGTGDGGSQVLVTTEAELVPREQEVVPVPRGVGIVAFYAIAFHHHLVRAFGPRGYDPLVAGETDPVRLICEELAVRRCVRVVAIGAIARFDGSMNERKAQPLLEGDMARQADLSLCALLQPVRILRTGERCASQKEEPDQ